MLMHKLNHLAQCITLIITAWLISSLGYAASKPITKGTVICPLPNEKNYTATCDSDSEPLTSGEVFWPKYCKQLVIKAIDNSIVTNTDVITDNTTYNCPPNTIMVYKTNSGNTVFTCKNFNGDCSSI